MEEELKIPVAFCSGCNDNRPVVINYFQLDKDGEVVEEGGEIPIVICPDCEVILSYDKGIEVAFYTVEDLEKATGWKVSDADN